jgi:hypothetical protein
MPAPVVIMPRSDTEDKVDKWIKRISEGREELGGHAICPYALSAYVGVIKCNLGDVSLNSDANADVMIFDVGDVSLCALMQKVSELSMMHPDYIVLDDHMDEPTYINGVQSNYGEGNLILIQKRDKLESARETLHKTDYYKYWSPSMYRRIVNGK